jgi:hypothetical protein
LSDVALTCQLGGTTKDIFVSSGFLRLRQRGPWYAYLECSSDAAPAELSACTVVVRRENGTADNFAGTVRRAVQNPGTQNLAVTVVGGAGKLLAALPPRDYAPTPQQWPAGIVARAICDDAGEVLAPGVEQALDATTLPRWHRATDVTAAVALDLLAGRLGYVWRVLPTGLVWMGTETWPSVASSAAGAYWTGLVEDDGAVLYTVRGAPFAPGQSVDVGHIGQPDVRRLIDVRYQVAGALIVELRGAVTGDPAHVPDLDLYRACYPGTVVVQQADGSLDVRCDDARMGELRSVPLRVGIPGATVTVPMGARVRVRFEGASPAGAICDALDQDPAATAAVSLVGDGITTGTLSVSGAVGAVLTWTPPSGPPMGPSPSVPISGLTIAGPGSTGVKLR